MSNHDNAALPSPHADAAGVARSLLLRWFSSVALLTSRALADLAPRSSRVDRGSGFRPLSDACAENAVEQVEAELESCCRRGRQARSKTVLTARLTKSGRVKSCSVASKRAFQQSAKRVFSAKRSCRFRSRLPSGMARTNPVCVPRRSKVGSVIPPYRRPRSTRVRRHHPRFLVTGCRAGDFIDGGLKRIAFAQTRPAVRLGTWIASRRYFAASADVSGDAFAACLRRFGDRVRFCKLRIAQDRAPSTIGRRQLADGFVAPGSSSGRPR